MKEERNHEDSDLPIAEEWEVGSHIYYTFNCRNVLKTNDFRNFAPANSLYCCQHRRMLNMSWGEVGGRHTQ